MTNIPDLTNASPGDVYQGPDGQLWRVVDTESAAPRFDVNISVYLKSPDGSESMELWGSGPMKGFKKVDG